MPRQDNRLRSLFRILCVLCALCGSSFFLFACSRAKKFDPSSLTFLIEANPVKVNLVQLPQSWNFCSCQDRFLADGQVSAWLPREAAP